MVSGLGFRGLCGQRERQDEECREVRSINGGSVAEANKNPTRSGAARLRDGLFRLEDLRGFRVPL